MGSVTVSGLSKHDLHHAEACMQATHPCIEIKIKVKKLQARIIKPTSEEKNK